MRGKKKKEETDDYHNNQKYKFNYIYALNNIKPTKFRKYSLLKLLVK